MYPLFTSIAGYRENHLKHHKHLNSEDDPDWAAKLGRRSFQFPKSKAAFLLMLLSYFCLYQGVRDIFWILRRFNKNVAGNSAKNLTQHETKFGDGSPKLEFQTSSKSNKNAKTAAKDKRIPMVFYIALFTVLSVFGGWKYYLLFWIIPFLSTFFMFQYIRSVAEHFGDLEHDHLLTSTRTTHPNLVERFFLSPHHVGYHLEHHLYPGVPFYNLPKLHQLLMEQKEYREKAHRTHGYVSGLLRELTMNNKEQFVAAH